MANKISLNDARNVMVERHLERRGIRDPLVLDAMRQVPRELFVSPEYAHKAYDDRPLPIGAGQTISQPYIVACMIEALALRGGEKVLEIGGGSGYAAAVLAMIAAQVFTIERYGSLAETAGARFRRLGLSNITQQVGDGTLGMPDHAPFDRIIVTAAAKEVPQAYLDQLAIGGILVIPVEERPGRQDLWRITRDEKGFTHDHLIAVRFVPLVEGVPPQG